MTHKTFSILRQQLRETSANSASKPDRIADNTKKWQEWSKKKVCSEVFGEGIILEDNHAPIDENGDIEWVTVRFEHGDETIFTKELEELVEEEQIDEISSAKLMAYQNAASKDIITRHKWQDKYKDADAPMLKNAAAEKNVSRYKGMSKAQSKLNKRQADLEQDFNRYEETEQEAESIDENLKSVLHNTKVPGPFSPRNMATAVPKAQRAGLEAALKNVGKKTNKKPVDVYDRKYARGLPEEAESIDEVSKGLAQKALDARLDAGIRSPRERFNAFRSSQRTSDNFDVKTSMKVLPKLDDRDPKDFDYMQTRRVPRARTTVEKDPATNKIMSWKTFGATHKATKRDPEGTVHHMSDVARRTTIKMAKEG